MLLFVMAEEDESKGSPPSDYTDGLRFRCAEQAL